MVKSSRIYDLKCLQNLIPQFQYRKTHKRTRISQFPPQKSIAGGRPVNKCNPNGKERIKNSIQSERNNQNQRFMFQFKV